MSPTLDVQFSDDTPRVLTLKHKTATTLLSGLIELGRQNGTDKYDEIAREVSIELARDYIRQLGMEEYFTDAVSDRIGEEGIHMFHFVVAAATGLHSVRSQATHGDPYPEVQDWPKGD